MDPKNSVSEFAIRIPEEEVDDLKTRLKQARSLFQSKIRMDRADGIKETSLSAFFRTGFLTRIS
ncbi:hypothetical protein CH375_08785 [Leptospira ellisii]|uniref:Uncharacterized protein n=1 Tax=Leptospira ellisii TaxID=2023197 RepID=A0A2N0BD27_9LEPT|nr:hypothetical protein CH379_02515 [Leptospira ellisii]PKA04809.1 hypothetical protein CH375_08785 [Leptospira ellisii]